MTTMLLASLLLLIVNVCLASHPPRSFPTTLQNIPKPLQYTEAALVHFKARKYGHRLHRGSSCDAPVSLLYAKSNGDGDRRYSPLDYGGDPTGHLDSTKAVHSAMQALLANLNKTAVPFMASGIRNLGGAMLDLAGGVYLISSPIVAPNFVGNIRFGGSGTLRASTSFPKDRYLIEIGSSETCKPKDSQNVCNEFVTIENLFFDLSHVAAGGVKVSMTMGTTVSNSFFIGFNQAGIMVDQGHETMVSECWLAEYYWSEKHAQSACNNGEDGSVGISVNGQDNIISNVIVFDFTCLGVLVNGAASLIQGVHSWNGGGVAISVNGTYDIQDRIVDSYLDYSTLQIVNPKFVLVEGNFFFNTHAVLLGSKVQQLIMRNNIYSLDKYGGKNSIVVDVGAKCGNGVKIEEDINGEQTVSKTAFVRQTRVKRSLFQKDATVWVFNFEKDLVFGQIDFILYSLEHSFGSQQSATHVAQKENATSVKIVVSEPVTATVHIEVAECQNVSN